eukprot:gnl/MRDRNA2_/MRDRNA2_19441_c0_seq1.p1 gnl/MRDRNA2_/MRDRNA2_19441_c0~~gnl/MRDRNA2_/MRDRNA2_19441_c0_seq1.p1  ORF type:complete len:748 (-),score=128.18 gnl/MRDRNA2_/MRDRNA2_19441_c0_seq1:31-2274(-)
MGRLMESRETNADVKKHSCLVLLQDVVTEGNAVQLKALREALTDHHAVVLCRHNDALNIVTEAWRRHLNDHEVAASAASILLLYVKVHKDALKRLDVCALCRETLGMFGAPKSLLPVGQLWRQIGGPSPAEVPGVLRNSNSEAETLKPLLRGLIEQKDLSQLHDSENQSLLEGMLNMHKIAPVVMQLLCRIAEPIKVPACDRGGSEDQSDGSNSDDDSDVEDGESTQAAVKKKKPPAAMSAEAVGSRESRVAGVQAFLEAHAESDGAVDALCGDACTSNDVQKPTSAFLEQEVRAHLAVESASALSWPVLFPSTNNQDVKFYKDFNGGNLRQVRAEGDRCFEIALCGDTNRSAYSQWFFFDVQTEKDLSARFHVVTFTKASSTFCDGQRVVAMHAGDHCWRRAGIDYAYFPNRYMVGTRRGHFTLAFSINLPAGRTRIAYFYPYTFGDVLRDLRRLRPIEKDWLELRDLGPTQGGHALPMLTITDFVNDAHLPRPNIIIMARVHPGEAPASFVMRGVLELLLADTSEAEVLRQQFTFVVFPMLNPDGVANGNGRSNNTGHDLNRCWENPPLGSEVAVVKPVMERLSASHGGVFAMLDLHAHSVRHGAFTFGNPGAEALPDQIRKTQMKESRTNNVGDNGGTVSGSLFDRTQCTFHYPPGAKRGAARCVAWREFGITHAHTVESTYSCMDICGKQQFVTIQDLCDLGRNLVRACAELAQQPEETEPLKGKRRAASKKKASGPVFELVL